MSEHRSNQYLGANIKRLRGKQGLSQEELAEAARVDSRTIQRAETGESIPQPSNRHRIAKALNVTVQELQEPPQNGGASDVTQTAVAPAADETTPTSQQPIDTARTEPITRNKGKVIRTIAAISVLAAALLVGGYALIIHPFISHVMTVHITGIVQCTDKERVVGVWIAPADSNGSYAHWYKTTTNGSEAAFNYDLPNDGAYNVHVGCGGSTQDWQNQDKTEYGSGRVIDYKPHVFLCQDTPLTNGDGPCYLQR